VKKSKKRVGTSVGPLLATTRLDCDAKYELEVDLYDSLCANPELSEKTTYKIVSRTVRDIAAKYMDDLRAEMQYIEPALVREIKRVLKGLTADRIHKALLPQAIAWSEKNLSKLRREAKKERANFICSPLPTGLRYVPQ
jgi:hypothetical protein